MDRDPYEEASNAVRVLVNPPAPETRLGLLAAVSLVDAAHDVLRAEVRAARTAGVSWARIGAMLGTSKQAAQQRFSGL